MNSYDTTKPYKEKLLALIRSTWSTGYALVCEGTYPTIYSLHGQPAEVDHTDGIGTKGKLHWQWRTFKEAVQDALAMNLNDLLVAGAIPYKLQNHLMLPVDDHEAILQIVGELCEQCRRRNICVTGGETSIQNNIEGMELSLCVTGFMAKYRTNKARDGDYVVGLESSGPHANGYTLLQKLMGIPPITPTVIYDEPPVPCSSITHIAGGAYTRLKGVLGDKLDMQLDFYPQKNEFWGALSEIVGSDEVMYKTFNCGYGMVYTVSPHDYKPECGKPIGWVKQGAGQVNIRSGFTGVMIKL